ncbi:4-alpha-glucanotransferase [Gordonia sp. HNM0687]|uniref:4-alpha-glucanotransferase n=1 Tax=Gordonia mangrovi TaxID=2665643 RepID=A0A6L7GL95_9ACTN|nr:4-alpha-glucanotransferase [Gordonia mangrovi]MXP20670.1 4-alpha-glucanotransferase [Gordonia mangrovi]UVF78752.1 4-alpha-glucanotransferase [Gordonia mangrovi]
MHVVTTDDGARENLVNLARRCGVADRYVGWDQLDHDVSSETIVAVLGSLGIAAATPEEIAAAHTNLDDAPWRQLLPPVTVAVEGARARFIAHVPHWDPLHVWIVTEDARTVQPAQVDEWVEPREVDGILVGRATFEIPEDLEPGYHRVHALDPATEQTVDRPLIVTPRRLSTADDLLDGRRWGLAVQLYSVRSSKSWGVGDFADLAGICEAAASSHGADFVQVNPLHAAQPTAPIEQSPYLPVTRRFVNPLYIRVGDIAEAADLDKRTRKHLKVLERAFFEENLATDKIKRNKTFRAKMSALEMIYQRPRSEERDYAYRSFRRREGKGLRKFATWCALAEHFGTDSPKWATRLRDREYVKRKRRDLADRVDFYMWLQWICDQQLAAAQRAALSAGMRIGIVADLAVGVARHSADVWMLGDVLARGATVGAPPDGFNQQGQNWDQPPWDPRRLAEAGYEPYRDMLRTVLRHAGGLRVDHILGLFRLWWIPDGKSPADGTYVHYDHDALIGILALEAERAGAVVIGEDLGVFEPYVQEALTARGILGTSILWFEHGPDAPVPPEDYRQLCLTSVTTHDLPPTVGYLAGDHIELRSRLGLLETGEAAERARDERDRDAVLDLARSRGLLAPDTALTGPDTVEALYRLIAQTPSVLLSVALVDAVGERRIQNQPGTDSSQYPNWCIPLADENGEVVLVEDLPSNARFASLVAALAEQGVGSH